MFGWRRRGARAGRPAREQVEWVRVAVALHQPEAELLSNMLSAADIPVTIGRAVYDVPDMLAGGPRAVMVPARFVERAREVLTNDDRDSGDII